MKRGQPVVSVDTKKKELVGDFKNNGREWHPKGSPEPVRVHDFIDDALGKVIPYGVYEPVGTRPGSAWGSTTTRRSSRWPPSNAGGVRWARRLPEGHRTARHGRRRRQQRAALTTMARRAAALRGRHWARRERLSLPARDEQVEQDRTPTLLADHTELAWSPARNA